MAAPAPASPARSALGRRLRSRPGAVFAPLDVRASTSKNEVFRLYPVDSRKTFQPTRRPAAPLRAAAPALPDASPRPCLQSPAYSAKNEVFRLYLVDSRKTLQPTHRPATPAPALPDASPRPCRQSPACSAKNEVFRPYPVDLRRSREFAHYCSVELTRMGSGTWNQREGRWSSFAPEARR